MPFSEVTLMVKRGPESLEERRARKKAKVTVDVQKHLLETDSVTDVTNVQSFLEEEMRLMEEACLKDLSDRTEAMDIERRPSGSRSGSGSGSGL